MNEKTRKTAFTVTASVMAVFMVFVACIFCDLAAFQLLEADKDSNIYVDGTDFSRLVELGTVITDSIIRAAAAAVTVIMAIVIPLAVWGIFRLVVFKNSSSVGKDELSFSRRVFLISSSAALVVTFVYVLVCAVQAASGAPFWTLLLCLPNPLFMWVFYILKLRKTAV